jgi:hypothetical protein
MEGPPEPGSPLESLIVLVWMARQEIRMQETRSIVQAMLAATAEGENIKAANDQLQKSWEAYLDELFPFQRGLRKSSDKAAMEFFVKEALKGPLKVTPLVPLTKVRSKLRTRYLNLEEGNNVINFPRGGRGGSKGVS